MDLNWIAGFFANYVFLFHPGNPTKWLINAATEFNPINSIQIPVLNFISWFDSLRIKLNHFGLREKLLIAAQIKSTNQIHLLKSETEDIQFELK